MNNKSHIGKPTLVDIVKRSIALAPETATVSELLHILENDWLSGAKSYKIPTFLYKDREFINPDKPAEKEIPAHIRHQLIRSISDEHAIGQRFDHDIQVLILIKADVRKNLKGADRIVSAHFIDEKEVRT